MLGLTLEGGASRTVYSCGIMDALLEENIIADRIFGVSAGAAFGVSYASKQIGRNYRLATEFMGTRKYMGVHHMFDPKNRSYYNLDYAWDDVPNIHLPFDYKAYREYEGEFYAVVTNVATGRAEYLTVPRDDVKWTVLRATCALPLMFPEIEINGEKYLDGGIADSIPYKRAVSEGCDKNIIVLTRPRNYVKTTDSLTRLCMRHYKKYPEFAHALETRAQRYNETVSEIQKLREQGRVFVFTPKTTFGVGRTEGDPKKLDRLYRHGYDHAKWAMDSLKRYLDK
ncbi:MAG: patatin family protein [Ruminococcus sp.]|nr:patatin family protein [Ruminococcus sp.]